MFVCRKFATFANFLSKFRVFRFGSMVRTNTKGVFWNLANCRRRWRRPTLEIHRGGTVGGPTPPYTSITRCLPPPVPLVCSTPNLHTHTSEASFVKQKKTRSRSLAGQVIDLGEYNDLRGSAFLGPTVPNPEPYESLPARHKRPNPICFPTRQALPGLPGDLLRVTSISTQKVLPLVPTPAALNSTSDSSTGHKSGTGDPQKRRQP